MTFNRITHYIACASFLTLLLAPQWLPPPDIQIEYSLKGFTHDGLGRPILSALVYALRFNLITAGLTTVLVLFVSMGVVGGVLFMPIRIRTHFKHFLSYFLAFPSILLALGLSAILPRALAPLSLFLFLGALPHYIRFMYVRAEEIVQLPYWEAALSLGSHPMRMIGSCLIPELMSWARFKIPVLFMELLLGGVTLSYLGIRPRGEALDLGELAIHAKDYLLEAPHLTVGLVLTSWFGYFLLNKLSDFLRPDTQLITLPKE